LDLGRPVALGKAHDGAGQDEHEGGLRRLIGGSKQPCPQSSGHLSLIEVRTPWVAIGLCRGKVDANLWACGRTTVRRCAIKDLPSLFR
jgi:hypothetical protein